MKMVKTAVLGFLVPFCLAMFIPACDAGKKEEAVPAATDTGPETKPAPEAKQTSGAKTETFKLKKYSCVDRKGIGIEAFSLLIPADWQFEGGIRWVLDNPGMPAVAAFTVRNPGGAEEFDVLDRQPHAQEHVPDGIEILRLRGKAGGRAGRGPQKDRTAQVPLPCVRTQVHKHPGTPGTGKSAGGRETAARGEDIRQCGQSPRRVCQGRNLHGRGDLRGGGRVSSMQNRPCSGPSEALVC